MCEKFTIRLHTNKNTTLTQFDRSFVDDMWWPLEEEEEEEEEDLFVFNDTIEGPRAPAVKPGRVTQA